MNNINGKPLFQYLEEMRSNQQRNEYVLSLIPHSVENKLDFMIRNVPLDANMYYLKWM